MPTFNVDFRFALIRAETAVARRHAEVALGRTAATGREIRRLVLQEMEQTTRSPDEEDLHLAYQEIYQLQDELPRLEVYSVFFVLFATFESVLTRLPTYVGDWTVGDLRGTRGDSFVAKAVKFYRERLHVDLFDSQDEENDVRLVADIRNAIGHATGRVSMLNRHTRTRLEAALAHEPGLGVVDGHLRIEPTYALRTAQSLDAVVRRLIDRLRERY